MTDTTGQDKSPGNTKQWAVAGVAFPVAISGVYDYAVPEHLAHMIRPGTPVLVDVRGRHLWGVVITCKQSSSHETLKPVLEARFERWTDANASLIKLYEWMAQYYACALGRVFRPLVGKGLSKTREKNVKVYRAISASDHDLTKTQRAAWEALRASGEAMTIAEMQERLNISPAIAAVLRRKKLFTEELRRVERRPIERQVAVAAMSITLTDEQNAAVAAVAERLDAPDKPFLLYGITGSGKTHVYAELARTTLARERSVIVLVPEISLTPQTIMRFRAAVGDVVTVLHSRMSDGERRDALQELVTGSRRMLIGVRSAILAPMDNVGLIVVDEEHDASYKQTDIEPRYNARDIAIMRGYFQKAAVVLGSATPSLESYYNATQGKYHLLRLTGRFGEARLPDVRIVDMNQERRNNNWTILSRALEERIAQTLDLRRQVILLLNRRGYSAVLLCKECGFINQCPSCSLPLRYHLNDRTLKCHLCGHERAAPDSCPVCRGEQMKYQGTGIQKAEELIRARFPHARILRMDHDTTRRKGAHHHLLDAFARREADILLGTQMVAKGLDFPGVALVGVLQADTGLLLPDFRASERTFQLLAQVAGRAGRSDALGEVVIQTCYPADPAIVCAARHDYETFYASELPQRTALMYPPAGRLARIVLEGPNENVVRAAIEEMAAMLTASTSAVTILGPSPAVLFKAKESYRYSLLLKSALHRPISSALKRVREWEKNLPPRTALVIDVDPVNML